MRHILKYTLPVFAVVLLAGCGDKEPPVTPRIDDDPKVLIMYDNIGSWFDADVNEAAKAVAAGALADKGHRVVVFHRKSAGSQIYELVRDKSLRAGYRVDILKQYAKGEMNFLSQEVINSVIREIRSLTPESNHYGLAFGSHGRGWIPKVNSGGQRRSAEPDPFASLWEISANSKTRYLAYDNSQKIDMAEFAAALDEWEWDFVLFDDCFMASVEALYEVRHLADYFIASPTEILDKGFPYDRVVERLFRDDWTNLAGMAADYVSFYQNSGNPYATISVVKADRLEALMESVRAISLYGSNDVDPNVTKIQYYEELAQHIFFDLDDYMYHFSQSVPLYEAFRNQLAQTVVSSAHTDMFYSAVRGYGSYIPVTHFSGLSVFIPWAGTLSLKYDYQQTEWYKAIYE
jgi:hypothetical protein